jgi:hypothetical protein
MKVDMPVIEGRARPIARGARHGEGRESESASSEIAFTPRRRLVDQGFYFLNLLSSRTPSRNSASTPSIVVSAFTRRHHRRLPELCGSP